MTDRIDIGIDGGGSGCRVVVVHGTQESRAEGGPANVVTDPASAEAAIREAMLEALGAFGLGLDDLGNARIVAGLAGCRLPGVADAFAMRLPFLAYVVDDSVTALEGAFAGGHGTLVNLGTGSFFIRKDDRGVTHHGGWGFVLGDEGSAAWLGRQMLQDLVKVEDSRFSVWADDPLRTALIDRMGKAHPVEFAMKSGPESFGALAPLAIAERSDWALDLQARLVRQLKIGLHDIAHPDGAPWVLIGGLGRAVMAAMPEALPAGLHPPKETALHGALAMARALP